MKLQPLCCVYVAHNWAVYVISLRYTSLRETADILASVYTQLH